MVTLDELLDAGDRQRDRTRQTGQVVAGYTRVGLWSVGWALAKLVALLLGVIAAVFFGTGWLAAKVVPALRWARTAFMLGWEAGRSRGAP
jgi:predicted tellurium resistance membrane protein TerC